MKIKEFDLERYFAKHEFSAKYLLSSSDCDGYALSEVLAAGTTEELRLWEQMTLGYTESQGHPLLREAIVQHYATDDVADVVVSSPGELIFVAMNVLLEPGDHAIVTGPCYQSLSEVITAVGASVSFWYPEGSEWQFRVSDLEQLIRPETKLLVINFPHNPTGAYLTPDELDEVVALARKHGLWLFSDEMYRKLLVEEVPELPPVCDLYEKGISLWGTSKSFGMAGLRIGWLVSSSQKFVQEVIAYKDYLSICNNAPGEVLTMIALNHVPVFVEPNIRKIQNNVARFRQFVREHRVFDGFQSPKAGSMAFVPLNVEGTSLAWSDWLVEQHGIMTLPAEMFHYDGKFIRVGFGRANFEEALGQLAEII